MKCLRIFGFAALTAVMALVFAGPASATIFTGAGGTILEAGTAITAENEGTITLHPPFGDIKCEASKVTGKTTNSGSAAETVKGTIETLTYEKCNATIVILKKGSFEVHTQTASANNNGTLTKNGTEVTVEFVGTHCIFGSSGSRGTNVLTGSGTTGGNATFDVAGRVPRIGGRSGAFCGSEAEITGAYKITSPTTLNID